MAIRFRRRVKVLPGLYINLSRSGVSTTIGPRGANISMGKKGFYLNTGIPGTGISNRQKLFSDNYDNPKNEDYTDTIKSPSIEEGFDNSTQDIITSEGLKGLKENLDESRQEIKALATEIKETINKLSELETELTKKKNGFFSKLFTRKETIENIQKSRDDTSIYLKELKKKSDESKADINIKFDPDIEEQYQKLAASFEQLTKCDKIWDITSEYANNEIKSSAKLSINRAEVKFNLYNIDFIKSKYPAFHFQNANGGQILIYPAFILIMEIGGEMTLIDIKEIKFNFKLQRFIEPEESIPLDTKIVDYSWAKVNKDGSPDMRFKGNYQTPVVNYGSFSLTSGNGLNETYYISNSDVAQTFANEFINYISLLNDDKKETNNNKIPNITKQYFEAIKEFADKFLSFITKIKKDKEFTNFIYQIPTIKQQPFETSDELINYFFILDIMKCFNTTADFSNLKSKEAFALMYLTAKNGGLKIDNYSDINLIYGEKLLAINANVFKGFKAELEKQTYDNDNFQLSLIIGTYNKDWQQEYLTNLYRFASIVVKADGTVSKEEEEALKKIVSLTEGKKNQQASIEKHLEEKVTVTNQTECRTLDQALDELNTLIGINAVKQEINSLINYIKVQKARDSTGLKSSSISYHIVFTGNPGTGKTTVARIVSEIYKNLGVLSQGQLIETDRSGLVAEFTGQTAIKVNKIVDSALNGILFIDEAYSLIGENQDDFGKEAVSTLIKRMEDNRDKLVVILAGYTDQMQKFIDTNPGFKSRFNRYIEFVDYNPNELFKIFKLQCSKLDYVLTEDAEIKLNELFTTAFEKRDKSFGNGRFVRNIFEKTLEKQANRIASVPSLTKETLTTITIDDIPPNIYAENES